MPHYFLNSIIVAVPAIFLILLFSSAVAFVVSRFSYWFNVPLLIFFMAANLLPQQVILQPLYRLYLRMPLPTWLCDSGLFYDSYVGLIAINVAFQTGFCTFVLANYMKTIPKSLNEAARVDGAGVVRQYFGIILPLCKPALAALAMLEFTFIYNDFLWAIVLMKSGSKRPITSALNSLQGQFFTNNNLIAAAALLAAIPTILVFAAAPAALRQRADARGDQGMSARIAFIGAGSVVFTKNLLGDILERPRAARRRDRAARHRRRPARRPPRRWPRYVAARARRARRGSARTSTGARRSTAPTSCSTWSRSAATRRRSATSRSRPATASARRSPTRSASAGSSARCAPPTTCWRSAARWPSSARRRWLLNYTNPMAMLCWLVYAGTPTTHVVGLCHSVQFTVEDLSELVGVPDERGHVPRRRHQPPGVHPPLRARRREPLPAPRRADRRRPGAAAPRARRALPAPRLLPDRVERARRRVRALVHAARRRARALPDPGRRVHPPQRGEPRRVRARQGRARARRGDRRSSARTSTRP